MNLDQPLLIDRADTSDAAPTIPESMTLVFREPISLGTEQYTQLDLTEPTADQLIKSSKAGIGIEQLVALIHVNAKVPLGVAKQMRQRDLNAASGFFSTFGGAPEA